MKLILTGDAGYVNVSPDEVDELKWDNSVEKGPTILYFQGCSRVLVRESVEEIMELMQNEVQARETN